MRVSRHCHPLDGFAITHHVLGAGKGAATNPRAALRPPRLTLWRASGHLDPLFHKNMQPTFRPHRKKRARQIGFRARMSTRGGRKVLAARRRKGRKRLTVV